MIIAFLSVNCLLFCFVLLKYQWKKKIFHSHIQDMARKHTWQFLSKLFFPIEGIFSHILFVIYGDAIYNASYFVWWITITAIQCGHPGQNKTSTLEKVERLEKLERIGGSRLHTQASKMLEMDRCHWCQRIAVGLKDFIQSHDTSLVKR